MKNSVRLKKQALRIITIFMENESTPGDTPKLPPGETIIPANTIH